MVGLVGILNITPDSFSNDGIFNDTASVIARAEQLFADGASLVDVGAESTRPGATPLNWQDEWQRLEPVLPELIKKYSGKLSLDTYHPETAAKAIELGDIIINDISGLANTDMFELVVIKKAKCIIGSMPNPDAQASHTGKLVNNIDEVVKDLTKKYNRLIIAGLPPSNIIFDPCIGFGKTRELNWKLLEVGDYLPGKQVMIGYSRKRFLGEDRMDIEPNLRAADIAVAHGTSFLRVHDVAAHTKHLGIK